MSLAWNSSTSQNLHGDAAEVTCKGEEQVISRLPPPSFSTRQLRLAASSGGSEKSYLSLLMLLGKMPLLGGQKIKPKYCISWTCYQEDDWFCVGRLWTSLAECGFGACCSPYSLKLSEYTWYTHSAWGYCSGSMSVYQCALWGRGTDGVRPREANATEQGRCWWGGRAPPRGAWLKVHQFRSKKLRGHRTWSVLRLIAANVLVA